MIVNQRLLRAVAETGLWAAGRRRRFRVAGASMEPTLNDGEFVLVAPDKAPKPGQVAVAAHPEQPDITVIKRVGSQSVDRVVLASDNPSAGTDSRQWGPVPTSSIIGTVTLVVDRPLASLGRDAGRPGPRWMRR